MTMGSSAQAYVPEAPDGQHLPAAARILVTTMAIRVHRRAALVGLTRAAVLPAAAFAVHQLRYALAFGAGAGVELQRQGHSYLHSVVPWIVLLVGLALGGFLSALGRAMGGQTSFPRYSFSLLGLWITCAACLVAIYGTQEFLEGLFATGHPSGLVGIFGSGGWWSVPAAVCVGLVLAALFHGARWAIEEVAARRGGSRRPASPDALTAPCRLDARFPRLAPLASGWSGRGPPS
jgi:hypothetical protein